MLSKNEQPTEKYFPSLLTPTLQNLQTTLNYPYSAAQSIPSKNKTLFTDSQLFGNKCKEENEQAIDERDMQLLRSQLWREKEKNKGYRTQMKKLRKYVDFLQNYNSELKKEVILWMNRPVKRDEGEEWGGEKPFEVQIRGDISKSMNGKSKNGNYSAQGKNWNAYSTVNLQQKSIKSKRNTSTFEQPKKELSTNKSHLRKTAKTQHSTCECTSCNYPYQTNYKQKYSNNSNNQIKKQRNCFSRQQIVDGKKNKCSRCKHRNFVDVRNLCPCHAEYLRRRRKF